MKATGGEALAHQLVREGIRHVFGVPGVQLDHAVDGLAQVVDDLTFVATRHEQAAAYMADGYARSSGGIGTCIFVPGPGMLNALAGLSTAYACNSRVLAIVGQVPAHIRDRGQGALHEIENQSAILDNLTKSRTMATDAADIPELVRAAVHELHSGAPRPVAIEIAPEVFQQVADIAIITPPEDDLAPTIPDIDPVRLGAAVLRNAHKPLIYVGGGALAAAAREEVRGLAESLDAPVVMSLNGRGLLSAGHPLAATSLEGRDLLVDADAILVVGSRFVDHQANPVETPVGCEMIYLNTSSIHFGAPRPAGTEILGDAAFGCAKLLEALGGHERIGSDKAPARIVAARAHAKDQIQRVQPQYDYVRALRSAVPDDGIVVSEMTQVAYLAQVAFDVYDPNSFLTAGYQGTLGFGFPTALGAKVANPGRVVVSLNGDGGFGWNLQELSTMRKYGIAAIAIIFDDGAFGNVRRTQDSRFDGRILGSELANPDFVMLAQAFGIHGQRVTSPEELATAIQERIAVDEPALIHVPVTQMPSAWHLLLDFVPAPESTN